MEQKIRRQFDVEDEPARIGRPPSNHRRLAQKAIEMASRGGLLPHEILLDMARGNPQKVRRVVEKLDAQGNVVRDPDLGTPEIVVTEEWVVVTVDDQRDAAKAAAPYFAPKLSNIETVQGIRDDDLDQLIEQFAAQAGVTVAAVGAGEEEQDQGAARGQPPSTATGRRRAAFDD